jgi:hypothetical protein
MSHCYGDFQKHFNEVLERICLKHDPHSIIDYAIDSRRKSSRSELLGSKDPGKSSNYTIWYFYLGDSHVKQLVRAAVKAGTEEVLELFKMEFAGHIGSKYSEELDAGIEEIKQSHKMQKIVADTAAA